MKQLKIRTIKWIENTLIKSKEFSLPKRKDCIEEILVDVSESPIERPKKYQTQKKFIQGRKRNIRVKTKSTCRKENKKDTFNK